MMTDSNADSRTARLAEQIRGCIAQQHSADGGLFMIEAQLVRDYGVSRNIACEAVSQLPGLGIHGNRDVESVRALVRLHFEDLLAGGVQ